MCLLKKLAQYVSGGYISWSDRFIKSKRKTILLQKNMQKQSTGSVLEKSWSENLGKILRKSPAMKSCFYSCHPFFMTMFLLKLQIWHAVLLENRFFFSGKRKKLFSASYFVIATNKAAADLFGIWQSKTLKTKDSKGGKNSFSLKVKRMSWKRKIYEHWIIYLFFNILKVGLSHSKKIYFNCFNKSTLKMMKNAFYFILKVIFVLKMLKFLPWHFDHMNKTT